MSAFTDKEEYTLAYTNNTHIIIYHASKQAIVVFIIAFFQNDPVAISTRIVPIVFWVIIKPLYYFANIAFILSQSNIFRFFIQIYAKT